MEILIKFKEELKQAQFVDRKILKQLELEIKTARCTFLKITNINPKVFEQSFPILYKEILISDEYSRFLKEPQTIFQVDLNNLLEEILKKNRKFYNLNQDIINAIDNDKIINYIDIQRLLMHFAGSKLSVEDTFKIFKLVVAFDINYLETKPSKNVPNSMYIFLLSTCFNKEGNFKEGKSELEFRQILEKIFAEFKSSYESLLKDGIIPEEIFIGLTRNYDYLIDSYTSYLKEHNEKPKIIDTISIKHSTKPTVIKKPPFGKLKQYYKNGIVIQIPDNIEEFMRLLDECGVTKKEQSNILKQINQKLENAQSEKLLCYLSDFDRSILNETIKALECCSDASIHVYASSLINDIKSYLELLSELYSKDVFDIQERIEEIEICSQIEILLFELRKTLDLNMEDFDRRQ